MAGKTGAERIQDTLSYLEFKGKRALADDIRRSASGRLSRIGEELSLESMHILPTPESINKRRALRALLLCQRVFPEKQASVRRPRSGPTASRRACATGEQGWSRRS